MEAIHYIYILVPLLSGCIIQIGLTQRRKIIEEEKRKRIEYFNNMDNSKINAIGNYEEKAKNKLIK
jgi:hypothetical protein